MSGETAGGETVGGDAAGGGVIGQAGAAVLTTIALCWRIERCDGVTIGLTAHDRDLTIDGLIHRAAPGMTPSAIRRGSGLEPDTMDVTGALDDAAIGAADLIAGRWDGARVRLFATDWTAPAPGPVLAEGTIGAVEMRDGVLTAELAGPTAPLDRPACPVTSPGCRAELGDAQCRVAMAGRRRMARVIAMTGAVLTLDRGPADGAPADAWAQGRLRWFDGPLAGTEAVIAAAADAQVTLRRAPRLAGAAMPLWVEVREGCDKRIETCATRFGNAANFRGEPYLPGIDLLTRYPAAG